MKTTKKFVVLTALISAISLQAAHLPGHLDTSHIKEQTSVATRSSKHILGGKGQYHARVGQAEVDHSVANKTVEISEMAQEHGRVVGGSAIGSKADLVAAKQKLKQHKQTHRAINNDLTNLKSGKVHGKDNATSIAAKEADLSDLKAEISNLETQINAYKKSHVAPKTSKLKKVSKRHSSAARAAHRGK